MVERREHQDARTCAGLSEDAPGAFDAVRPGHADIHEHDVRIHPRGECRCLQAVRGLAHDIEVILAVEDDSEAASDESLVIRDEDADHATLAASGKVARIANPQTSRGPTVMVPP